MIHRHKRNRQPDINAGRFHSLTKRLAFYSANMLHFFPHLEFAQHIAFFKETCTHQQRNGQRRLNHRILAGLDAPPCLAGSPEPGIIATFHTGAYPLVAGWLMRAGFPLTLVLSPKIYERQRSAFLARYRELTGRDASPATFGMLTTDDTRLGIRAIRALRNGHFILLYVDGNMGATQTAADGQLLCLDFFAGRLSVRTGVAQLSFIAKCPIYPLLAVYSQHEGFQWGNGEIISPAGYCDKRQYITQAMQNVYCLLEQCLQERPGQWEGWLYVHHDTDRSNVGKQLGMTEEPLFFFDRYLPFQIGRQAFLLDKAMMEFHGITPSIYAQLAEQLAIYYGKPYF